MIDMGNIKIAIDINDVIRDNSEQILKVYKKFIDNYCTKEKSDLVNFDTFEDLDFNSRDEYENFKYVDYAYEIYGRAEPVEKILPYRLNDWLQTTMRDFEEDKIPEIIFVSPFEIGLTIQATLSFLSRIGTRVREIYFPIDSMSIWDRCDILITANPNLIENKPEGKKVFKINAPYNTEAKGDYEYDSLLDIIYDKDEKIIKLIEE